MVSKELDWFAAVWLLLLSLRPFLPTSEYRAKWNTCHAGIAASPVHLDAAYEHRAMQDGFVGCESPRALRFHRRPIRFGTRAEKELRSMTIENRDRRR